MDGYHIPLIAQWGIWKPGMARVPLSISTAPRAESEQDGSVDGFNAAGQLRYMYRGTLPYQHQGLRDAMRLIVPLIYFRGVARGLYRVSWPVYIIGDDEASMTFTVSRTHNEPHQAAVSGA